MSFKPELTKLDAVLNFSNGRTSPERAETACIPVFGSNGLIGNAAVANSPCDTIIVGRVGSYCGSVHFSKKACWITDNAIRATAKGDNDPRFLYYLLTHLNLNNWRSGSGQPLLNQATLNAIEAPVPLPLQQRAISGLIGAFDDRITLLRETNATLEGIAQALFKSWFVDFDPVRAKMEGRVPDGMDEATAALFPDGVEESELGMVPIGWKVEPLENWLSALETGRRPKGGVSGILGGVPSIGAESIVRIGHFDYSKTKFVSTDFFDHMKSGKLVSNDVLLYKDGGKPGVFLPRVAMFGDGFPFEKCGINEHVFRLRLKTPFNQPFLYFWLWSDAVMHELKHRGGKAAIPGINQSDVKEQKLSVPDSRILNRFEELVSPLVSQIFNNAKAAQTLVTLRDTLLPRLISGLLLLPDVVEEIEAVAA